MTEIGLRHTYRGLDNEETHGARGGGKSDAQLRAMFASMGKSGGDGQSLKNMAAAGAVKALTPSVKQAQGLKPKKAPTQKVAKAPIAKVVKAPKPHASKPHAPHTGGSMHTRGHQGHNPLEVAQHVTEHLTRALGSKVQLAQKTLRATGEAAATTLGHKTVSAVAQEGEGHHFGLTHAYSYGDIE